MRTTIILVIFVGVVQISYGYPPQGYIPLDQEAEPSTDVEIRPSRELGYIYESPIERIEHFPEGGSELDGGSQNFYPSFFGNNQQQQQQQHPQQAQPHGHSRPYFHQQEGAYSQRAGSYRNLALEPSKYDNFHRAREFSGTTNVENNVGILGSGNFGVIKGGTFYNDQDDVSEFAASKHNIFSNNNNYYNNGHGRPSFYFGGGNPRPYQHEQFANFKDFAEINAPAYSHFVVVYVNQNGTKMAEHKLPKNIIETLDQLDTQLPAKKLSKSKRKLAKLLPEKKIRKKTAKVEKTEKVEKNSENFEPLLALS